MEDVLVIWKYYLSARVELRFIENGLVRLGNLFSKARRQGHASELMRIVLEEADEKGWTIVLEVGRYGHPIGPDNDVLIKFYESFDFTLVDDPSEYGYIQPYEASRKPIMIRTSQDLQGL